MSAELVSLSSQVGKTLAEIHAATEGLKLVSSVSDDAGSRAADAALTPAKTLVKCVHDQRMSITRKVDAFKKSIIAEESAILADLNREVERVKELQLAYVTAKAARLAAADEAAKAARHAAEMEARLAGETVADPVQDDRPARIVDGVSTRTTWAFRIVDADAVPRAYCSPDEAAIRSVMSEARRNGAEIGSLNIPGVEFYRKVSV